MVVEGMLLYVSKVGLPSLGQHHPPDIRPIGGVEREGQHHWRGRTTRRRYWYWVLG